MASFNAEDAADALQRLATRLQTMNENLAGLEDQLGTKVLDNTAWEGVTSRRRTEVLDGFARLWALYEGYRIAVEQIRTIMAQRAPAESELRKVEALVNGAVAVELPELDGATPLDRQVTLDWLATEIDAGCRRIHETLSAVDQVWTELAPRLDGCAELLSAARTLAGELGLSADHDAAPRMLAGLAGRLSEIRRIVRTDPLRFWLDGAVVTREVDQLGAQCDQAGADLRALAELRERAVPRLDQVDSALTEVAWLHRKITEERRRADVKIKSAPAAEPAALPADPLRTRLRAARELCRRGQWRRLGAELPALEREVAAAVALNHAELIEVRRPLLERAELRGRLSSYRAKAAGAGRIEDLALEARYQRAHDLLWSAPCDLAAAAAAVTAYRDAVNGSGAEGGPA